MLVAIVLSLVAWFAGYAVGTLTGSWLYGALALVGVTVLELVAGIIILGRRQ